MSSTDLLICIDDLPFQRISVFIYEFVVFGIPVDVFALPCPSCRWFCVSDIGLSEIDELREHNISCTDRFFDGGERDVSYLVRNAFMEEVRCGGEIVSEYVG